MRLLPIAECKKTKERGLPAVPLPRPRRTSRSRFEFLALSGASRSNFPCHTLSRDGVDETALEARKTVGRDKARAGLGTSRDDGGLIRTAENVDVASASVRRIRCTWSSDCGIRPERCYASTPRWPCRPLGCDRRAFPVLQWLTLSGTGHDDEHKNATQVFAGFNGTYLRRFGSCGWDQHDMP